MHRNAWGEMKEYDIYKVCPNYIGIIKVCLDCNMTNERVIEHLIEQHKLSNEEAIHTLLFTKENRIS